jgi:hypothetical protein
LSLHVDDEEGDARILRLHILIVILTMKCQAVGIDEIDEIDGPN